MSANSQAVARFVTITMGLVIGLTFLFGFGNVLNLALKLQVPVFVAPLVAPAVDLTVLGLLVGTRHLALSGAPDEVLRPARRLLMAASSATLLLNVADPVCAGQWGKAGFDAVGPLLLIGWAEVGPALLRTLQTAESPGERRADRGSPALEFSAEPNRLAMVDQERWVDKLPAVADAKLERARTLNREHWNLYRRPISAETLRRELGVGSAASRKLCATVRSEMKAAMAGGHAG